MHSSISGIIRLPWEQLLRPSTMKILWHFMQITVARINLHCKWKELEPPRHVLDCLVRASRKMGKSQGLNYLQIVLRIRWNRFRFDYSGVYRWQRVLLPSSKQSGIATQTRTYLHFCLVNPWAEQCHFWCTFRTLKDGMVSYSQDPCSSFQSRWGYHSSRFEGTHSSAPWWTHGPSCLTGRLGSRP